MLSAITNADGRFLDSDMFRRWQSPSIYCARLGGVRRSDSVVSKSARTLGTRNGILLLVLALKNQITLSIPIKILSL